MAEGERSAKGGKAAGALSPRQRAFVAAYRKTLNATKAAAEAGYSEKTARQAGARLLSNAAICEAIEAGLQKLEEKTDLSIERLEAELARIAFVDPRRAYGEDGRLLAVPDMPEDVARALAGFDVDELLEGVGKDRKQIGLTRKLRWHGKVEALRLGLQRRGALVDLHKLDGPAQVTFNVTGIVRGPPPVIPRDPAKGDA